jgi:nitrile hydratase
MDGIHDLGGMHGFGRVPWSASEPAFHAPWEGRVFALASLALTAGVANIDAFRHAIERLAPVTYLTSSYFGRWLAATELLLRETAEKKLTPPTSPGTLRTVARGPRFKVGARVRTRPMHPSGHTRLPRYARGLRGTVALVHPAFVFPDTNAHGQGEEPQHVYAVRFAARDLWGDDAEPGVHVHVDCFERYLEPARR